MENKEPMKAAAPDTPATPAAAPKPAAPKPVAVKPAKSGISIKVVAIILAVVLLFVTIFSIVQFIITNSRLNNLEEENHKQQLLIDYYNRLIETGQIELRDVAVDDSGFDDFFSDDGTGDSQQNDNTQQSGNQDNTQVSNDPTKWTTAQIVEAYKHAAAKTHPNVKSQQMMTLRDNSLKAPGIDDWLVDFSEGVMKKALNNNSKQIDGLTGGHQNLKVSDVKSARAYKSGNNIVIEMLMKEQIDDGAGDMYSGTVGHAISVVGDIDVVVGQFSGLGMKGEIADKDCKLHYKNPIAKVAIDKNGRIINGTWSYYTDITLNNLSVTAIGMTVPVKQATAIVDFAVTLNGGFKA